MAGDILEVLGFSYADTKDTLLRFRLHDEALLDAAYADHHDFDKLTAGSKAAQKQLEELFEQDAQKRV